MSRGPGALQRQILDELARMPTKRLPWTELKRRFPIEARQRSFHRAVHGLLSRRLVYEQSVGEHRYIGLRASGDTELLALCNAVHAQLNAVARARGVRLTPTAGHASPRPEHLPSKRGGGHLGRNLEVSD